MAAEDVRKLLGEPHWTKVYPDGGVGWYYNMDIIGASFFGVLFDQNDRVELVHI